MNKSIIRKEIIEKRNKLSEDNVALKSKLIFENLFDTNILDYNDILVYSDFKNEVQTGRIIRHLLCRKKRVYLPVCDFKKHTFGVSRILTDDFECLKNIYGISEPTNGICKSSNIDCAIVPGVAFDENGRRIGFGGGYYDRFFAENINVYKIGLCFEFQLTDGIVPTEYDIPMDLIVTEKRTIVCKGTA